MTRTTKCISFLLITALLLSLCLSFASCGDGDEPASTAASKEESSVAPVSQTEDSSEAEAESSAEESSEEFVKLDKFYNTDLYIFGKKDGAHVYARRQWEYDPELVGDAINDAVNDRNQWLADNYGINVKYIADSSGEYFITKAVELMINSDTTVYDVVCDGLTTMATLATNGRLYPLNGISDNLDLSKPWWDSGLTDALSIGNDVYYAAGDVLITDDEYTYCLLYNKDTIEEKKIASSYDNRSLYQIVNDNEWTYDNMFAIAKQCAGITSGGSSMTLQDDWGYVGDIGCLSIMMTGGGYKIAEKDKDDIPVLRVSTEYATSIFNKLTGYMNDATFCKFTERFGVDGYYGVAENMFASGQITFYNAKLSALTTILSAAENMATVGVLPIPKASVEQENYYNAAAPLHFSCIGIPVCVDEDRVDMVCAALEALGYLGRRSLTTAYIETTLKLKRADETDDSDMIDLILNSRCFDLAATYNWGGLNSFFNQFAGVADTTGFVSAWKEIEGTAQSELEATIAAFSGQQ